MATISIEGGTDRPEPLLYPNSWRYRWTDNGGPHEVIFQSFDGVVPKVGDSIVNGVLVPLVGIKSNQDHSKWVHEHRDSYGRQTFPTAY